MAKTAVGLFDQMDEARGSIHESSSGRLKQRCGCTMSA
jgi:hypothetical protein